MKTFNEIKNDLINFIKSFEDFNSYNFEASNLSFLVDILSYFLYDQEISKNELLKQSFLTSADDLNFILAHSHNQNKKIFRQPETYLFEFNPGNIINADYFEISPGQVFSVNLDGFNKILSTKESIKLKNSIDYFYLNGGNFVDKSVKINKNFPIYTEENIFENLVQFPTTIKIYYSDNMNLVNSDYYDIYEYKDFFVIYFKESFFRFNTESIKISILTDNNSIDVSSIKTLSFIGDIYKVFGSSKIKLNDINLSNISFRLIHKKNKFDFNDIFRIKSNIINYKSYYNDFFNVFLYDFSSYFDINFSVLRYVIEKNYISIYPYKQIDNESFLQFLKKYKKNTLINYYKKIYLINPIFFDIIIESESVSSNKQVNLDFSNNKQEIIDLKNFFIAENINFSKRYKIFLKTNKIIENNTYIKKILVDLNSIAEINKIIFYYRDSEGLNEIIFNGSELNNLNLFIFPQKISIFIEIKNLFIISKYNFFFSNIIITNDYRSFI